MRLNVISLVLSCFLLLVLTKVSGSTPPNIIIILVDDMGYGDAGFNGCKDIPTPNIDNIALNGIRFKQGYVTAPQCGPSRAGLMSGISQCRLGMYANQYVEPDGFAPDIRLIGTYLKEAGYSTGIVGKWHLGRNPGSLPLERGFDWFYGFLPGGSHFFPPEGMEYIPRILENNTTQKVKKYLTDAFGDAAVRFIKENSKDPFFLYLSFNAPHAPLQAPDEYLEKFAHLARQDEPGVLCKYTNKWIKHPRQVYAAMVSCLDDNIGRVVNTLDQQGIEDNTLIFFLSDNGGPTAVTYASNDPLRGVKGDVLEGGVRVPFALQWKKRIKPGQVIDTHVSSLDIFPTSLAAAEINIPGYLEGLDLLPMLTGTAPLEERELFWNFPHPDHYHVWGIRSGNHKLVAEALRRSNGKGWHPDREGKIGLYNIQADIKEENDLSDKYPDLLEALKIKWELWNEKNP